MDRIEIVFNLIGPDAGRQLASAALDDLHRGLGMLGAARARGALQDYKLAIHHLANTAGELGHQDLIDAIRAERQRSAEAIPPPDGVLEAAISGYS